MRDCIMQKNNISNQTWSGLYFQLIWFILSILQISQLDSLYVCFSLVDLMVILNVQNVLLEISATAELSCLLQATLWIYVQH